MRHQQGPFAGQAKFRIVDISDLDNPKVVKSKIVARKCTRYIKLAPEIVFTYSEKLDQLYYSDEGSLEILSPYDLSIKK
jgi:hypothetical protein